MDLQLEGQVALVTAASRGLGLAAARAFAREGARVMMCARSQALDAAVELIQKETGAQVLGVRADVTSQDEIRSLVEASLRSFKQIDILVINAGGPKPGGFLDLEPADWQEAVRLTLMSAVWLCYEVVPHMLERGRGSIVTTQSYSIKQPVENLILSNSLRLGVIGMMKSMANELGPKGIRINSINPAWTQTERVEQLMADRASRNSTDIEAELAAVTASLPLRRMGTVEEFGRTIAWLASPAAAFIHGHALMFDGGGVSSPL